jgi:hypothetical protein
MIKIPMINLPISKEEILSIIQKVKENIRISSFDNLRGRHPNIQFDCLLRGYIGEYVFEKFLTSNGISIDGSNCYSVYDGMDVDFLVKGNNVELKVSLVPDIDTDVKNVISRDIKILKRSAFVEDLKGDIHVQLYINQRRKAKDDWLIALQVDLNGDSLYLYDKLLCKAYLEKIYFVGWIDKPTLVGRLNKLPPDEREWSFSGAIRSFWKCSIKDSKPPLELIEFLKEI